jgi:tryptophan synthase alpha chain
MNRIHELFNKKKNNVLSIYFTAGYPSIEDTLTIIKNLSESGVDMIEIGFPFSDPLADGPVIQASSSKAIENGMTLAYLFEQLKEIRTVTQVPLILMGYLNPVLQFGERNFLEKCKEVGIDGVILPDMPLDYFEQRLKSHFDELQIANILLITPETDEKRIRYIDEQSSGFVYLVSSNSITGENKNLDLQSDYFIRIREMSLKNPALIGFGIKDYETFQKACSTSNGAIIGTAFIQVLDDNGLSINSINKFIQKIKYG